MNITMDVLRMITVKALQGRTWCGQRVYDSPAEPADLRLEKERAPYIGVFIDDGDFPMNTAPGVGAASLYDDGGTCWLLIEVAVAGQAMAAPENAEIPEEEQDPAMQRVDPDEGVLAYTDAAMELRIGLISRQVMDALADPDNPWANLWKVMCQERIEVQIRRGGSGSEQDDQPAVRYASRHIRMHVGLLAEPAPGAIEDFWSDFFALAATDNQIKRVAAVIRQFLEPEMEAPWKAAARAGTLTPAAIRGIGLGPALRTLDGQPWDETPPKMDNTGVEFIQE